MIKSFLVLAFFLTSGISFAEKCETPLATLYSHSDFPPALLWLHKGTNHEAFAAWAVEKSNKIANELDDKSTTYILLETAKARGEFARKYDHDQSELFGELRLDDSTAKKTQITTLTFLKSANASVSSLKDLKDVGQIMIKRLKVGSHGKLLNLSPANQYTTYKGDKIPASIVYREGDALKIRHPAGTVGAKILTDILARLEILKNNTKLSKAEKQREFVESMFGYYNSMPFHRGSAAIGKVFFAGIHLAIFKTKIPELPDMLDVRAMVMDRSEFVADTLKFF